MREGRPRKWWAASTVACVSVAVALILSGCATTQRLPACTGSASEVGSPLHTFALLGEAADHEALYTLVGGLKPMSTGFWGSTFAVDDPDLADLRCARAALAPLCNDVWYADVQVFDDIYDGERSVHAYVVHRAAMARMIERYEEFWNQWGITCCTHPSEVVAVVDRMPKADRWRGYGHLFGYPKHAVDFFVESGLLLENDRDVGPGQDRQFVQIPTHAAEMGRFTYAVPLDHVSTAADNAIASKANCILAAYTERKGRMRDARSMIAELRTLNQRFESMILSVADVRGPQSVAETGMLFCRFDGSRHDTMANHDHGLAEDVLAEAAITHCFNPRGGFSRSEWTPRYRAGSCTTGVSPLSKAVVLTAD